MNMQIRFYPLDVEYKGVGDEPVIQVFGRTGEGELVCVLFKERPYLWIVHNSVNEILDFLKIINLDNVKIIKTEVQKKFYLGKEVKAVKAVVQIPAQIPVLREYLEREGILVLESDILFNRRFLVDNEIVPGQEYIVDVNESSFGTAVKTYE